MAITKEQAMTITRFEHVSKTNADGSPIRARATGKCQVWKTRPEAFKLPVKHGMRDSFYITEANADQWQAA